MTPRHVAFASRAFTFHPSLLSSPCRSACVRFGPNHRDHRCYCFSVWFRAATHASDILHI